MHVWNFGLAEMVGLGRWLIEATVLSIRGELSRVGVLKIREKQKNLRNLANDVVPSIFGHLELQNCKVGLWWNCGEKSKLLEVKAHQVVSITEV